MGLGNLSKKAKGGKRDNASQEDLDKLAGGAALKTKSNKRGVKYKVYTFSLTPEISDEIDQLTMAAPRLTRSEVVKKAVSYLASMPDDKVKGIFK